MCVPNRTSVLIGAALAAMISTAPVQAANITFFQFMGDPDFRTRPAEFGYSPLDGLTGNVGAVGNGSFFSPGMLGLITGGLDGITLSPPGLGFGPTYRLLSDLSLELSNFTPDGSADVGPIITSQELAGGSFVLKYTPRNLAGTIIGPDVVLLTGSAASATLVELNIGQVGAVLSGVVTYTGGLMFDGFAAAGLSNKGSFSFAMTGIADPYTIDPTTGRLGPFLADGVGTFDAAAGPIVPLPQSVWAGIGLTGFLIVARYRNAARAK